jgi:hypothetical protein
VRALSEVEIEEDAASSWVRVDRSAAEAVAAFAVVVRIAV